MANLSPRPTPLSDQGAPGESQWRARPVSLQANEAVMALDPIATPATATAEDVADAYNALLAAMQGA